MSGETTYDLGDPAFLKAPQHMLAQMRAEGSFVPIRLPVLGRILVTTTHFATAQVAKGKDTFFLTGAFQAEADALMPRQQTRDEIVADGPDDLLRFDLLRIDVGTDCHGPLPVLAADTGITLAIAHLRNG